MEIKELLEKIEEASAVYIKASNKNMFARFSGQPEPYPNTEQLKQNKGHYLDQLRDHAAEFLEQQIPDLANLGKPTSTLLDALGNEKQLELRKQLQELAEKHADTSRSETAINFFALSQRYNYRNFISVFGYFLTADQILKLIHKVEGYPGTRLSHIISYIRAGEFAVSEWKKTLIQIAFDDATSRSTLVKLLTSPTDSNELTDENYENLKVRIYKEITSYQAGLFFDEDAVANLPESSRLEYLQAIQSATISDTEWRSLNESMKKYDLKLNNAGAVKSEETLDYLGQELDKSDDLEWILSIAMTLPSSYRRAKNFDSMESAIMRFADRIDFSELDAKQVQFIHSPENIEKIIVQCDTKSQKALWSNYNTFIRENSDSERINWEFIKLHIDQVTLVWFVYSNDHITLDRSKWFWQNTRDVKAKRTLLRVLYSLIVKTLDSGKDSNTLVTLYGQWMAEDNDYDHAASASVWQFRDNAEIQSALLTWPHIGNNVKSYFAVEANGGFNYINRKNPDAIQLLQRLCAIDLESLVYHRESQPGYLAYLSDSAFEQLLGLLERIAKSSAAVKPLAQGLANISCHLIKEQNFYCYGKKNIREAAQWSLVLSTQQQATTIMIELLNDKKAKLDDSMRSHFLDVLEQRQHDISRWDPTVKSAPDLAAYCEKRLNTTMEKRISRIWSPELEAAWPEDNVVLKYALCVLAGNPLEGVPRFTRRVMEKVSPVKQRELSSLVVNAWSEGKGDKADFWVLDLLHQYFDENTVPSLQKLVVAWHKKYRMRACAVVRALGAMNTAFSLSACDEFYAKAKYNDDVRMEARQALVNAAEKRGITLPELYDELIPTFGLTRDGLCLDTGSRQLVVKLKPTLALEVLDTNTGKSFKSLPKAKQDEDPDLRADAERQFNLLKKNIKPVVKKLQERFSEAFQCGQSWNAERWKQVFLEHPILSLIGQGFVWQNIDRDNKITFRMSEDLSLIDSNDDEVNVSNGQVLLMHPAEVDAEITAAWKQHLEDYEITSFIDQLQADDLRNHQWENDATSLDLFAKQEAQYGKFKRLMEKHNYQAWDGDGSWVASYRRNYTSTGWQVEIGLEECRTFMSFDDAVIYGSIQFIQNKQTVTLGQVPRRLISSVVSLIKSTQ